MPAQGIQVLLRARLSFDYLVHLIAMGDSSDSDFDKLSSWHSFIYLNIFC